MVRGRRTGRNSCCHFIFSCRLVPFTESDLCPIDGQVRIASRVLLPKCLLWLYNKHRNLQKMEEQRKFYGLVTIICADVMRLTSFFESGLSILLIGALNEKE